MVLRSAAWVVCTVRMVPCDRTHDLRSGCQNHHPSKNSVQKTICYNLISNAPDDGRMYPKHVELRIHHYNYLIASCWHFTLFHEEDARSHNPQATILSAAIRRRTIYGIRKLYLLMCKFEEISRVRLRNFAN